MESESNLSSGVTGQFDYQMVQLPQTFVLKKDTGKEIAVYLQDLINKNALFGWEFYRIDSVGVAVNPGCLASLFGARNSMIYYNVVSFRRPKNNKQTD